MQGENICYKYMTVYFNISSFRHSSGYVNDYGNLDGVSIKSHDSKAQETRVPLKQPRSSRHGFATQWGPTGFKKELHPLSIMVLLVATGIAIVFSLCMCIGGE